MKKSKGLIAISPLLAFLVFYLGLSILAGDFYSVPITVAFLATSVYAVIVVGKGSLTERVSCFCQGAANENMMMMILIFILAGAFASTAKAMGSIDATVNLTLSLLPPSMLLAGLFLASCFISLSIGTSVGTIAALVPIAVGLSASTQLSIPFLTAIVVGGAFFGDNMSFISDTTIMATRTQGCRMSDKFRTNAFIVIPAAVTILGVYLFMGQDVNISSASTDVNLLKVLPYLVVLTTAVCGINVMAVLTLGILMCAIIGIADGSYNFFSLLSAMGTGIGGMSELIIVTLLAAGLLQMVHKAGGIDFIIKILTKHINGKRGAEATIAALVSITDMCTANNTIAILTVGDISSRISKQYGVDPRRTASILDTMSCFMQGLIPYGAQLLIAAGLAGISTVSIIPSLYYPMMIGLATTLAIVFQYPKRYTR